MSARKPKLTEAHRFTICVALRQHHNRAMEELDFHSEHASYWLREAGESWGAYKAFAGSVMHDAVST